MDDTTGRVERYKRLGHLVVEHHQIVEDDGTVSAPGSFGAELYECSICRAVVWYPSVPEHTAWHSAPKEAGDG